MSRNFEYLGETFQIQLINQLIVEKDFSHTILDVLEPTHFENKYFKTLVQLIKEYYTKYECSTSFETLFQIVKSEFPQELMLKILNDTITKIQKAPSDGAAFVQEKALKFCKQQELQKAITKSQKILDSGEFENYDKLEELIKAALQVGENNKNVFDVFNEKLSVIRCEDRGRSSNELRVQPSYGAQRQHLAKRVGHGELEQFGLALEVLADERVGDHSAQAHAVQIEGEESARRKQGRAVAQ